MSDGYEESEQELLDGGLAEDDALHDEMWGVKTANRSASDRGKDEELREIWIRQTTESYISKGREEFKKAKAEFEKKQKEGK